MAQHWRVYLPALLGSFVLMLPPLLRARQASQVRGLFIGSVVLLLLAHLAMPWLTHGTAWIGLFLLLFFAPFNVLEACLPSLVSRIAPAEAKGTAIFMGAGASPALSSSTRGCSLSGSWLRGG